MQNKLSRRRLVTGAAWAAPVVVASSAVPAFASSREEPCVKDRTFNSQHYAKPPRGNTREKVYDHWTVPDGVTEIKFYVRGAAGGSLHLGIENSAYGGAGAEVGGYLNVEPGETLTFITGASGTSNFDGQPAPGGQGFGDGGDSIAAPQDSIPDWIYSQIKDSTAKIQYGASGGGASAIVRMEKDGVTIKEVIAIAGGGGGAGITVQKYTDDYPRTGRFDARLAPFTQQPSGGMQVIQNPRQVDGREIDVVERVTQTSGGGDTVSLNSFRGFRQSVYGGEGASKNAEQSSNGRGGAGGKAPISQTGGLDNKLTFAPMNEEVGSFADGDSDGNVFSSRTRGEGADDTNDPKNPVKGGNGVPAWGAITTTADYHPAGYKDKANYYVYATSGAGGGGYGGGGSGSASGQAVRVTAEGFEILGDERSPRKFHYSGAFVSVGAGGAGGSYLAPGIENWDGRKFWAHNNRTYGVGDQNGHGRIKVIWCDPKGSFKDYPDSPGDLNPNPNN